MKIKFTMLLLALFVSLTVNAQSKKTIIKPADFQLFGKEFAFKKVLNKKQMLDKYKILKKGDTLYVKYYSNIKSVCQKKGCWMKMDLASGQDSFVRFKDYGFFVPLNAGESPAVINGKAYIDVVSVDELKHYAKDAGKSQAEIDKITEPEVTYAFLADGVYIKK